MKPLFPLAASVESVFIARVLDRIGKGIRGAPRDALSLMPPPDDSRCVRAGRPFLINQGPPDCRGDANHLTTDRHRYDLMSKNPRSGAISALRTRSTHVVSGRKLLAAIGLLLIVSISLSSGSQSVTPAWDASSDSNVSGYRLRYGTISGNPAQPIDVGRSTTAVVLNLNDGTTYFFTVIAYNAAGLESNPSNEIS